MADIGRLLLTADLIMYTLIPGLAEDDLLRPDMSDGQPHRRWRGAMRKGGFVDEQSRN